MWAADHLVPFSEKTPLPKAPTGGHVTVCAQGATREADLPLFPPTLSELLRTECVDIRACSFDLAPGFYTVRLIVGETFEGVASFERRFDLTVNGRKLPKPLHPFVIAQGFARAGVVTLSHVKVETAGLTLLFDGTPYNCQANLYGIEVLPGESGGDLQVREEALAPQKLSQPPKPSPAARRLGIYFAGNSGLFFWAIPQTLQRMISFSHPQLNVEIDGFFSGGKNVRFFEEAPEVEKGLTSKSWDYCSLMDSSAGPIEDISTFEECIPRLIEKVRAAGTQPVLYAYNGPSRFTHDQRQSLQKRYTQMGATHRVPVIPCADALNRAIAAFPGQNFHNPDQHHLGMLGGFLFACVWYRALTGQSAKNLPEHTTLAGYVTVPEKWAKPLIEIADETCLTHGIGKQPLWKI